MATSDATSPSSEQLAEAAHAAHKLRAAIRHAGLAEVWPADAVFLDQRTAQVAFRPLSADTAKQVAEQLETLRAPSGRGQQ